MTLKPCPMCGSYNVWGYISQCSAAIRCKCGVELKGAHVRTLFMDKESIPLALERYAQYVDQPIEILSEKYGQYQSVQKIGFWWVPPTDSFRLYGHEDRWNRRLT